MLYQHEHFIGPTFQQVTYGDDMVTSAQSTSRACASRCNAESSASQVRRPTTTTFELESM